MQIRWLFFLVRSIIAFHSIVLAHFDEYFDVAIETIFQQDIELPQQVIIDVKTVDKLLPVLSEEVIHGRPLIIKDSFVLFKYSFVDFPVFPVLAGTKSGEIPPFIKSLLHQIWNPIFLIGVLFELGENRKNIFEHCRSLGRRKSEDVIFEAS